MSKQGVDYIGVCVVFFCHDGNGKFIMAKRSLKTRDENGRWDIGGGGLEFGERVEDALRREVKEEYGADIIRSEFLGMRDVHRQHNGNPTHWIGLDFKVQVNPAQVINGEPESHDEIRWFTLEALPQENQIHSQWPVFLNQYREKLL